MSTDEADAAEVLYTCIIKDTNGYTELSDFPQFLPSNAGRAL